MFRSTLLMPTEHYTLYGGTDTMQTRMAKGSVCFHTFFETFAYQFTVKSCEGCAFTGMNEQPISCLSNVKSSSSNVANVVDFQLFSYLQT